MLCGVCSTRCCGLLFGVRCVLFVVCIELFVSVYVLLFVSDSCLLIVVVLFVFVSVCG